MPGKLALQVSLKWTLTKLVSLNKLNIWMPGKPTRNTAILRLEYMELVMRQSPEYSFVQSNEAIPGQVQIFL